MKKVFGSAATFLFVVASCGDSESTNTTSSESVLENLRRATVFIESEVSQRAVGGLQDTNGKGSGSGFFISQDGLLVTNFHVAGVSGKTEVKIRGEVNPLPATLIGNSLCSDLTLLKVDYASGSHLKWSTEPVNPGEEVYAAGFPGATGQGNYTLTEGIISTDPVSAFLPWADVSENIYHSASINSGNSGGPLIRKSDGNLLGVNYAGLSSENRNIAISSREAQEVVQQLENGRLIDDIGMNAQVASFSQVLQNFPEILSAVPMEERDYPAGLWVSSVRQNSKADQLGLQPGDVIIEIDGISLDQNQERFATMSPYCDLVKSKNLSVDQISFLVARLDEDLLLEGSLNGAKLSTAKSTSQSKIPLLRR